ncbi:MAG TPA: hypothetical protein VF727_08360 [Allosphingosinicella sp.]|jgi:hypothetical protein
MPDLSYLQSRADSCRSLAAMTQSAKEAEELRNLALVYEAQVRAWQPRSAHRSRPH